MFEGRPDDVERLVEFTKTGPRHAEVESVDVREEEPEGLTWFRGALAPRRQRAEQPAAVIGLRMPLHAERPSPVGHLDRLDHAVLGLAADDQALPQRQHRLVVVTVGDMRVLADRALRERSRLSNSHRVRVSLEGPLEPAVRMAAVGRHEVLGERARRARR